MITLVTVIHVLVCIFLCIVILLQSGHEGGMGAAFGGGGSGSVFGGRGAGSFLGKVTGICAAIFMVTSVGLSWHASHGSSVVKVEKSAPAEPTPGVPGPTSPPAGTAPAPAPEGKAPAQPSPGPAAPATAPANGAPKAPAQAPSATQPEKK